MTKVQIVSIDGKTNNKLQLVKAIKFASGMGLKESKDIADEFFETNKKIIFQANVNKYELDDINKDLIPNGYKIIHSDAVQRDITIAQTLAIFRFTMLETEETTFVTKGSYDVNDKTGAVEIIVEEGTWVLSDYETKEVTNSKFVTHISRLLIKEEI